MDSNAAKQLLKATKLVTAIITTHNRRELCERALESVLNQTYPNIECIIVDDASEGGPNPKWEKDSRIQYVYIPQKESRGGNHARNVGIHRAKGEYIAFLDDDDYWLPTKTEKQLNLLEENNADVAFCGRKYEIVKPDGTIVDEKIWIPEEEEKGCMKEEIRSEAFFSRLLTSGLMFRKEVIDLVGEFDENIRYWQEHELAIRVAQYYEFFPVREALWVYRIDIHDKNRLTNQYTAWKRSVQYVNKKHKKLFQQLPFDKNIEGRLYYYEEACARSYKSGMMLSYYYNRVRHKLLRTALYLKKKV